MTTNKPKPKALRQYYFDENGARITTLTDGLMNLHDSPHHVDYYVSLGGMLHAFSMIEKSLAWLLSIVARADPILIKSIVYPLRVDSAIKTIKKVITAKKLKGKRVEEIIATLDHLSKINKTRNDILHSGAMLQEGDDILSINNNSIAFHESIKSGFELTNNDLVYIQHDLNLMIALWVSYDYSINKYKYSEEKEKRVSYVKKMAADMRTRVKLGSPIPWLYKFPEQKGPANKTRKRRNKPKSPPQSSQG